MRTKLKPNILTYQALHIVIHGLDPFEQQPISWLQVPNKEAGPGQILPKPHRFQAPAVLTFKKQLTDAFDRSAWVTENANCLHEACKLNTKLSKRGFALP